MICESGCRVLLVRAIIKIKTSNSQKVGDAMKYGYTVLAVADVRRARKFYEELLDLELYQDYGLNIAFTCGLSLQQKFDWLVGIPAEHVVQNSNNMELAFETDDFDGLLQKLKAYPQIRYLHDVVAHSWGQRVIRFYDLDGHLIEVGEAMALVIRRFLEAGLTMEQISVKMDASISDLEKLLQNS